VTDGVDPVELRLSAAAQAGDRRAFDTLVTLHKATLYRFVRRYVGNADDAYDLLQDTFISAWTALPRFDRRQSFSGWLRAIALNKCRDYGRRLAVRRRFLEVLAAQPLVSPRSEGGVEADSEQLLSQHLQRLDQAIAALPRLYKEPLLLTLVSGLTQEQAAHELKTSTKAIETRIRRAKRRLREVLVQELQEHNSVQEG
jgi:RNA polymerase sigma-70 factor (ECF subfamily)